MVMFQSLEGFMVDGNLAGITSAPRGSLFQSLEGFMVDGNRSGVSLRRSVLAVSIPRRVYGWWEHRWRRRERNQYQVSIPRRVYGWWEHQNQVFYTHNIEFQSLEGFMVDGNMSTFVIVFQSSLVSIPRRVYGWWEPRIVQPLGLQFILFQSIEGFMVDGNLSNWIA